MKKIVLIVILSFVQLQVSAQENVRKYWSDLAYKMSVPVLKNMSEGKLHQNMPAEYSPTWDGRNKEVAYMEAFGRLMAGIVPWLSLPDDNTAEGKQRKQLKKWALQSYKNAVDPQSPDYLLWEGETQILVDASYIATSFMRAPKALWEPLDQVTKDRYIKAFKKLEKIKPAYNNWLLFRATIETFLLSIGAEYDGFALEVATRKINEWYVGDGFYSDGKEFSLDYYNAYVIHPMLVEDLEIMERNKVRGAISFDLAFRRMQRYNILIERMISPEATYPPFGRSVTYRMATFQTLALAAWKYKLPEPLTNGQVRNALTSVMKRLFSGNDNFNKAGFLNLGFLGSHPNLADYYSNNGSMYMTSLVFLPLGLPADHDFWTAPNQEWTSQKAWGGKDFPKDYHQSVMK
ncbi:MAG: DUF2264 domain-containing protein [Ornithobacterium rhinotracheale]|nr:DUF2264 domain-containing protein [Ornithobacterium rhinotracheale]